MKLNIQQEFDSPLSALLRAREERYKHLDKFPELQKVHTVKEIHEGHILRQIRHIAIADSLPPALTALMPPGSANLVEESEFDLDQNLHTFRITPGGGLEHLFVVQGVSRYAKNGEEKSIRSYDLEITSKAFLVGTLIEGAIAELYRKNLEKDKESIAAFIKMLGDNNAPPT